MTYKIQRYKPNLSFENWTLSNLLNIKHKPINAHAIGVGFWCKFDIQGSPEPQNSNEANESSRFYFCARLI